MPGKRSPWIHEMSHPEVSEYLKRRDIVLVPFGATEQHGAHAPISLDTAWAEAAAEGAALRADALIAPAVPFGWSHSHMGYAGTITITAETMTALALDICRSLIIHGFRKVIIVNGNRMVLQPLEIAAVKLRSETGAVVAVADCGLIARNGIKAIYETGAGGLGHAGEVETSMMLARNPDFVDMSLAVDGTATSGGRLQKGRLTRGHTNLDPTHAGDQVFVPTTAEELVSATASSSGVRGDATRATAEKGRRIIDAVVAGLVELIEELAPLQPTVRKPPIPV